MSSSISGQNLSVQNAKAGLTFGGARVTAGAKDIHAGSFSSSHGKMNAHDLGAKDVNLLGVHLKNAHVDDASYDGQLHLSGSHVDGVSWNPVETAQALKDAHLQDALKDLQRGKMPHLGIENASASGIQAASLACDKVHLRGFSVRSAAADSQRGLAAQGVHADSGSSGFIDFKNLNVANVNLSATGMAAHEISIARVGKNLAGLGTVGLPIHLHDYTA